MSSNTTRRSLLIGSLLLSSLSKVSPSNGRPAEVDAGEKLKLLQQRRDYLVAEIQKLDRQWAIANELLPSCCQLGPKYEDEHGRPLGPMVGWPETNVHRIQINQTQWLIRPSPNDLRELFGEEKTSLGRDVAISNYRVRVGELRNRLQRRREIHQSVGLPTSHDWLPLDLGLEEVEAAISSLLTGELFFSA